MKFFFVLWCVSVCVFVGLLKMFKWKDRATLNLKPQTHRQTNNIFKIITNYIKPKIGGRHFHSKSHLIWFLFLRLPLISSTMICLCVSWSALPAQILLDCVTRDVGCILCSNNNTYIYFLSQRIKWCGIY